MTGLVARLDAYEKLMRLDKPIGILLLLWPTLWALWLGNRETPDWRLLLIFVVGTILMRSAGCALNDWADRDFDRHVERTKDRPLASGLIKPWEALVIAAVLALVAFLMVATKLNELTIKLAVIAVVLAAVYPFTKRFFVIPQAWLGIAFGFGIPMAFAAQLDRVPVAGWLIFAANFFWVIAYDTEYAMVDRADDAKLGLKTSALFFGEYDVIAVMSGYAAFLVTFALVGVFWAYGKYFYLGLAAASAICVYHYFLIRGRTREGCFKAFRHNHWIGLVIFIGIFLDNFDWKSRLA
jgi:4-hydroxybenzoate polyprenyltransferase